MNSPSSILQLCAALVLGLCLGGCPFPTPKGPKEYEAQKQLAETVGQRLTYELLNKKINQGFIEFDVKITNESPQAIYDIEITCNFIAATGTKLDEKSHLIPRGVPSGAFEIFPGIAMRLPAHTARAFCLQTYLKYGQERLLTLAPEAPGGSSWFLVGKDPYRLEP